MLKEKSSTDGASMTQHDEPTPYNFASSKHPHEPDIPPALDAEGRCLICGMIVKIADLERDRNRLRAELNQAGLTNAVLMAERDTAQAQLSGVVEKAAIACKNVRDSRYINEEYQTVHDIAVEQCEAAIRALSPDLAGAKDKP